MDIKEEQKKGSVSKMNLVDSIFREVRTEARFSIKRGKTETKPITTANHSEENITSNQSELGLKTSKKRGKTRVIKSRLALVLILIGRESGVSFLYQSDN